LSGLKEKFSKILVAIDGSGPSIDAVDYAIDIAQRDDAELTALYVVSSPRRDDYASDMIYDYTPENQIPETVKKIVRNAKKESQPWFNEITEKVRTTVATVTLKEDTKKTTSSIIQLKTQVIVSPISVTGSIVEYAERENIDLIVIGTRGRSARYSDRRNNHLAERSNNCNSYYRTINSKSLTSYLVYFMFWTEKPNGQWSANINKNYRRRIRKCYLCRFTNIDYGN
jgi:nucleotide-binding universal stress UspA family protein